MISIRRFESFRRSGREYGRYIYPHPSTNRSPKTERVDGLRKGINGDIFDCEISSSFQAVGRIFGIGVEGIPEGIFGSFRILNHRFSVGGMIRGRLIPAGSEMA